MKKIFIISAMFFAIVLSANAQKYQTRTGQVNFSSSTSEELIEATNNNVAAQLNANDGSGQFIIPIKSFKFKKALLQEHFNENYMESDKYPKATYKFTVTDIQQVNLTKDGRYKVNTEGTMTIKNTAQQVTIPGYITVNGKSIKIEADFDIAPATYGITIPKLVEKKIAKSIKIKVNSTLNP